MTISTKSISIVIPAFNGQELLDTYLPSVIEACKKHNGKWEIIIVDDESDPPLTLSFLNAHWPITLIRRRKNGGFSQSMNTGIDRAAGEIIIALNNDVKVAPDFIAPLLRHFDDPKVFSVKPKSILPDGTNESVKRIVVRKGMMETISLSSSEVSEAKEIQELPYACAGSAAYERKKLLELRGFDELYSPFYWEDFDLGYRAVKRGWKNLYDPQSLVYHDHGATISKLNTASKARQGTKNPQAIFIRNREIFFWKNIGAGMPNIIALLRWPIRFLKAFITGKQEVFNGLRGFLMVLPQVMKKRMEEKKQAIVRDKDIIEKFRG